MVLVRRNAMRSGIALLAMLLLLRSAAALGQGAETFKPTETVAPNIPGVVAAGTKVLVVAQGLAAPRVRSRRPTVLSCSRSSRPMSSRRSTRRAPARPSWRTRADPRVSTYDPKGRLIGVLPATKQIGVLTPTRTVLASTFEGRPFLGPNDLVADKKGGVYFTDPGGYPPAGQYLTELPSVYYLKPDGSVIKIADDIPRPNGIILSPDEKTLYVSNTLGAYVIAFDVQPDGSVRNQRNFARLAGIAMTNRGVRSGADGTRGGRCGPPLRHLDDRRPGIQPGGPAAGHDPRWEPRRPAEYRVCRTRQEDPVHGGGRCGLEGCDAGAGSERARQVGRFAGHAS